MRPLPIHPLRDTGRRIDDCWNQIGVRGDRSCIELRAHVHCRNCPTYSAAAAEILDRPLAEDHRAAWTAHYSCARAAGMAATMSGLVFRLGAEWLAFPTRIVHEIAESRPVHAIPRRRSAEKVGLVNIRGDLVVHVSLATVLEIDDGDRGVGRMGQRPTARLVVAGDATRRVAFHVSEVGAVVRYDPAALRPVPSTLARASVAYTSGMLALYDRTVACLDPELTMQSIYSRLA